MVTNDMLKKIPKVELHDHLDGGLRPATIIELSKEYGIKELPSEDPRELAAWFHRGADRKNLGLYLEGFGATIAVMQTKEALERIAYEALEDQAAENVVYAEIRFAPIQHLQGGVNLEAVIEAVLSGLKRAKKDFGIAFGLILCAMRHQDSEISLEIAELAVTFRDKGVVGFDIAGDEFGHPPKRHLDAFQHIRNRNFNITIHAGEAFGPESIWQAIQICGTQRIGHGTRLIEDMVVQGTRIERMGSLSHFLQDKRVPFEMCLSSNLQTGVAESIENHPFNVLYKNAFRVTLCTDNRLMSNTTLTNEMSLAVQYFGLTLRDLEKITINAMKSAFVHHEDRIQIIYDILKPGFAKIRNESAPYD